MNNEKTLLAQTISGLRRERKISQRRAADELGVSQAMLSHYENGVREPRLPFVLALARYYGVSADFILGGQVTDCGDGADRARGSVEHALAFAKEAGGEEAARAASRYVMAAAANLMSLLEDPERPYEPRFLADISAAECELVATLRRIKEKQ